MKIVFFAAEMSPFAKVGGLADILGELPQQMADLGHQVYVIMPRYHCVDGRKFAMKKLGEFIDVDLGQEKERASVKSYTVSERLTVYFIDHPFFFERDGVYGTSHGDYEDNDKRFIFFSKASLELLKLLGIKPDIVHCHDWQTGLIPAYIKLLYKDKSFFSKTKSFFTIHNLAYQGNFPPDTLSLTGFSWDEFTMHRMEFFGKLSFLKTGLIYSDIITTVSPTYAQEIQTHEFGCGLEGVLTDRNADLYGVLNGVDPMHWDPENDKEIPNNYTLDDLSGKAENKKALQEQAHLTVDPDIPLFGIVTRLVDQKGIDLILESLEGFAERNVQFVLLGKGMNKYHNALTKLSTKYAGKFKFYLKFDEKLAKHIYSGSDVFLVPSVFEPCGLGQIIALRYGTPSIVRNVGGLSDTINDFNPKTKKGNGFVFEENSSDAFLDKIDSVLKVYSNKSQWGNLIKNAMKSDYSIKNSAKNYIKLYKEAKRKSTIN